MKKFIEGVIVTAIILSFSLTPLFAQANENGGRKIVVFQGVLSEAAKDEIISWVGGTKLKSLIDDGDNVCIIFPKSISKDKLNGDEIGGRKFPVLRSIGKDLDAFIHSTTKSKVNGEEIDPIPSLISWRDKMLVVDNGPGANGEENCIPILSNRIQNSIMYGVDTNVEEIELANEKIGRN